MDKNVKGILRNIFRDFKQTHMHGFYRFEGILHRAEKITCRKWQVALRYAWSSARPSHRHRIPPERNNDFKMSSFYFRGFEKNEGIFCQLYLNISIVRHKRNYQLTLIKIMYLKIITLKKALQTKHKKIESSQAERMWSEDNIQRNVYDGRTISNVNKKVM